MSEARAILVGIGSMCAVFLTGKTYKVPPSAGNLAGQVVSGNFAGQVVSGNLAGRSVAGNLAALLRQ